MGFEPTRSVSPCRFSRPVLSTTQPPIRALYFNMLYNKIINRQFLSRHRVVTHIYLSKWREHNHAGQTDLSTSQRILHVFDGPLADATPAPI